MSDTQVSDIEYSETFLPSRGQWYEGKLPGGAVSIRRSKVSEDLILDSSNLPPMDRINRLVAACTKFAEGFTVSQLLLTDRMSLALAIRTFSYGPEYTFPFVCQNCQAENMAKVSFATGIDFAERTPETIFAENKDDPAFKLEEPFTLELPSSKKVMGFRHLRVSDDDVITRRIKNDELVKARQKAMTGIDISPMVQLSQRIVTVDGLPLSSSKRDDFVLNLASIDNRAIRKFLSKFETGIRLSVLRGCTSCAYEQRLEVPISMSVFRGDSYSD